MKPHILQNLRAFLERVELKGTEVPAYLEVMNALSEFEKREV